MVYMYLGEIEQEIIGSTVLSELLHYACVLD